MREQRVISRALAVLCFLLFSAYSAASDNLPKGIMTLDGRAAPALLLDDMDGEPWDIGEARGRWVFVHFWAAWCGPCRREMPTIQAIYPQFDAGELEIVIGDEMITRWGSISAARSACVGDATPPSM